MSTEMSTDYIQPGQVEPVTAEQCSSTDCQVTDTDAIVVGSLGDNRFLKSFVKNERRTEQDDQSLTKKVSDLEKQVKDLKNRPFDLPGLYKNIDHLLKTKSVTNNELSPVATRLDLTNMSRRRPSSQKSRGGLSYSQSMDQPTSRNTNTAEPIQRNRSQSDVSFTSNQSSGYQSQRMNANHDNTRVQDGNNGTSADESTNGIKHQSSFGSEISFTIEDSPPPVTSSTPGMQRPMSHLYDINEDDENSKGTDLRAMITEALFSMESVVRTLMTLSDGSKNIESQLPPEVPT